MRFLVRRPALALSIAVLSMSASVAQATVWSKNITGGTMTFDDWGYVGPGGRTATSFNSINGFGANALDPTGGVAQIQHVVTTAADRLTPDRPYTFKEDLQEYFPNYRNANVDTQVNFYKWGYTTKAGSTFSNMQIDYDGDYHIARSDMNFNYYDKLDYQCDSSGGASCDLSTYNPATTIQSEGIYDTNIDFQPYALSDAKGWCGSVMASSPAAQEAMAGQVQFDFGFEAYLPAALRDENGVGIPGAGSMQIVRNFQMRSYGSLTIDVSTANGGSLTATFQADAVVNNTDPTVTPIDPNTGLKAVGGGLLTQGDYNDAYYNKVSFMGGGIVPEFVWVILNDYTPVGYDGSGNPLYSKAASNIVEVVSEGAWDPQVAGAIRHRNSFANYPFLLRADGVRILDAFDMSYYSDTSQIPAFSYDENGNLLNLEGGIVADLSAVPVPAAVWLFGSGLVALVGVARKKRRV